MKLRLRSKSVIVRTREKQRQLVGSKGKMSEREVTKSSGKNGKKNAFGIDSDISGMTIYQMFSKAVETGPNYDCMAISHYPEVPDSPKHPQYTYYSYLSVDHDITSVASFFLKQNYKSYDGEAPKIGLWMNTSYHMRIIMMACHKAGLIIVPVYDSLRLAQLKKIFTKTQISAIVVDSMKNFEASQELLDSVPSLENIIKTPCNVDNSHTVPESAQITNYDTIIKSESERDAKVSTFPQSHASDIAYILSTSGSTGESKCVPVTHANVMCVVQSFKEIFRPLRNKSGVCFTNYMFLPFAHIFGLVSELPIFALHGRSAYPSGFIRDTILSDLKVTKPDVLIAVPIVLQRVYDRVMSSVAEKNFVSRLVFHGAMKMNITSLGDLVFKQVRAALGGRLKLVCAGGAYVSDELYNFAKKVIGVKFTVGYGLTEGIVLCQEYNNTKCQLGIALDFIDVSIRDVPEMNYYSSKGQGELLVKGTSVFSGYYKDEVETAKSFTEEGYFCTGDIVEVCKDLGKTTYKFIDRVKNVIKLSQGEYVAPQMVQSLYENCKFITGGVYLHGDMHRSFCIAIGFIPRTSLADLIKHFSKEAKIEKDSREDFDKVVQILHPHMVAQLEAQVEGIPGYSKAKSWMFTSTIPSIDNGMLTDTQKPKRFAIAKHFKNEIEQLCQDYESKVAAQRR